MKTAVCLLYCFLLGQCSAVYAGDPVTKESLYTIRHFTDQDGLPQNSVMSIAPDKNGFLWLLTQSGWTRFDGRQFLNFNAENIAVNRGRMHFVYPDAKGTRLFAMTEFNEVLAVENGRVVLAKADSNDYSYLRKPRVRDTFYITRQPVDYLKSRKEGYFMLAAASNSFFHISKDTIRFEKDGRLQYQFTIPALAGSRLFIAGGNLCYLDNNGQLLIYEQGTPRVTHITGDLMKAGQHKAEIFWSVATGQAFAYTDGNCYWLKMMQDGTINSLLVLEDFDFSRNSITSLYYDEMYQRLFLGSNAKGLFVGTRKQFRALRAGASTNEVYYAQAPYGSNGILAATGAIFDSAGTRQNPLISSIRMDWDSYSIARAPNGDYWFKNERKLFRLNKELTRVLWVEELSESITQVYLDKQGRLWVGGMEKGVYMLDTKATVPKLQLYTSGIVNPSYIIEETPDIFWLGTRNGLFRLHLPSHRIDTIKMLSGKYVRSIYIPQKGEVWITTYNDGIFLHKNNIVTQLPLDRRQYMAAAHCILEDKRGYFWVTTNKGLFQFSRKDALAYAGGLQQGLFCMYYGKDQGFNINEFNGGCEPCALQLQNGDISLPSLDGLVYFNPDKIRPELPGKGIFIDKVELDTKQVKTEGRIGVQHNFRQLKFYLSAPYFGDPANLQLYYAMKALNSSRDLLWVPVNSDQTIEFSSLPAGEYELHIRKVNGFGKDDIVEKVFRILVQPAWYETTWFGLLAAATAILLIFGFIWLRIRRVQEKNRLLETHVSIRTRELKETLDTLQSSERQLRKQAFMQQRLLAAITHDIKTPLDFLITVIGSGYREGTTLNGEEREVAYESLQRMRHLVENLVRYMKSQYLTDDSSLEIVDMYLLLEEKSAIFRPVAQSKGVSLYNDTPLEVQVLVNRQLLSIVLHNLMDNAVKCTKQGDVCVKASCTDEILEVQLTDTGIGMSPELINWINAFGQNGYEVNALPFTNTGLGLLIVMELLQLINGSIVVSRNREGGTTIRVIVKTFRKEDYKALFSATAPQYC